MLERGIIEGLLPLRSEIEKIVLLERGNPLLAPPIERSCVCSEGRRALRRKTGILVPVLVISGIRLPALEEYPLEASEGSGLEIELRRLTGVELMYRLNWVGVAYRGGGCGPCGLLGECR